jgi:hypothetical protein
MTDYESVVEVFESEMREKYELPPDLIKRWFRTAVATYSLDISLLLFDESTGNFQKISDVEITILGYLIYISYLRRERSRIGKLNNIIGKDIQLNATQYAKSAVRDEHEDMINEVKEKIHKLKQHSFN